MNVIQRMSWKESLGKTLSSVLIIQNTKLAFSLFAQEDVDGVFRWFWRGTENQRIFCSRVE